MREGEIGKGRARVRVTDGNRKWRGREESCRRECEGEAGIEKRNEREGIGRE